MANRIESRNYNRRIATLVFCELNKELVRFEDTLGGIIICSVSPDDDRLIYPDGWYPAKGYLRNKLFASLAYAEIPLCKPDGSLWRTVAQMPEEMGTIVGLM